MKDEALRDKDNWPVLPFAIQIFTFCYFCGFAPAFFRATNPSQAETAMNIRFCAATGTNNPGN